MQVQPSAPSGTPRPLAGAVAANCADFPNGFSGTTIDRELAEIKESLNAKPGGWQELLDPVVKAALVVGVGLAILQQVTGINTVIYHAPAGVLC